MFHPVSSPCSLGSNDFFNGRSSCQSMIRQSLPEAGDIPKASDQLLHINILETVKA